MKASSTLVVVTSAGSFPLLRYVAARHVREGRSCALLYMGPRNSLFERVTAAAEPLGIEAVAFEEVLNSMSSAATVGFAGVKPALIRALIRLMRLEMPHGIMKALAGQLAAADAILDRLDPTSIIVAENGISGPLAFLTRAKSRGIICATIPYGNARPHDLEIDLQRKRLAGERNEPNGKAKLLMRLMMRRWIKTGREAGATMFQPKYIMALEAMGITLENPWIVQGGPMDVLCVESPASYDQYLLERMPVAKLKLTGSPYCDEMMDAVQADPPSAAALFKPHLIDARKPRILISWPPDYHSTHVGKSEFPSYEQMTARYIAFLRTLDGCEITFSMHPSAGDIGERVMRENNVTATKEHLVSSIPKHDIFISFFSSATRWAIAAGKPVVNIDLYGQKLPNFTHLPGVIHTETLADFSRALSGLVASEAEYREVARAQIDAAPQFGMMDGQCVERIMSEIDRATTGS